MKRTTIIAVLAGTALATSTGAFEGYVTGDFHTHTNLSDGSVVQSLITENAFKTYGLDWLANTDHGGAFNRDPYGAFWDTLSSNQYIKGIASTSENHRNMWRWQSLLEYSFPLITQLRDQYIDKKIIQGFEWNCPSHEHANIGIISNEGKSVSDFEYLFDQNDKDTSRNTEFGITSKQNRTHADALAGLAWLQKYYPTTSYVHFNHPSRKLKYSISDFRDFYNCAPELIVGIEGMPGHQKEATRCGYTNSNVKAHTYGGTDYMFAKVGGLWDAMLSEGRKVWITSNSDFHDTIGDFWPGEFQKNYTYVKDENNDRHINMPELISGMKSGNSFVVSGDLIKGLNVKVKKSKSNRSSATLGQTLNIDKNNEVILEIELTINDRYNNNDDRVFPDHVDIILGAVHTPALSGTTEYSIDTVATTQIVKSFRLLDFARTGATKFATRYKMTINDDSYIRIRGTNVPINTPNETDSLGNPLDDTQMGTNTYRTAYADLWFYSNPVFISVNNQ